MEESVIMQKRMVSCSKLSYERSELSDLAWADPPIYMTAFLLQVYPSHYPLQAFHLEF